MGPVTDPGAAGRTHLSVSFCPNASEHDGRVAAGSVTEIDPRDRAIV